MASKRKPTKAKAVAKRGGFRRSDGYSGGPGADAKDLPPDFVGIIDERGKVLIDDTAYFRIQAEERPIWEQLRSYPRYEELHEMIRERLMKHGEEHNRDVGLRILWLEQYIVGICACMLRDGKEEKG
jgi:hypothetical protein